MTVDGERDRLLRIAVDGTPEFREALGRLEHRGATDLEAVEPAVREIVATVRAQGDAAVRRWVRHHEDRSVETLMSRDYRGSEALESLPATLRRALENAAGRIRKYHERQRANVLSESGERGERGIVLATRVAPLERVGVYVPGGKARYPSTVLMAAIPAAVAGVEDVVVATPAPMEAVRAACHLAGVSGILDAGGAQAVAALAYGTETVPRVDKIVGPGNVYVAAAKRLVSGQVAIDGIAGPTEILVVADDAADPNLVASDLLSQAEHDEAAYPLLLCRSVGFAESVAKVLARMLPSLPTRKVASAALHARGTALVASNRARIPEIADRLAPEHLALHTSDARDLAGTIRHAGALFVGPATPEAVGDYLAGPSHVLPTGGSARFGDPLGVYDFVTRASVIEYDLDALRSHAADVTALARAEGLEAHARAVEARFRKRRE